jgi:microcystin-dependent protein
MDSPFLGVIVMGGWNFAPRGWAYCDGQLLPISQNSALFSLLGTTYGGDGRTTFALPDLRGRVPVHPGNGPGLSPKRLGQRGGAEDTYITTANMPAHTHAAVVRTSADTSTTDVSENNYFAHEAKKGADALPIYSPTAPTANMGTGSVVVGSTGGSQPVNNEQPYLCVSFVIATQGMFPSRS